ncbi:uncharacterized protein LOC112599304 [Melanaphis sacchari]|uniref:uncharacterized protein LOC112599304 n=1 Tax=Melanaphis sacchari TaxID=742174 RepID=UPI000DC13BF5|nr:uncharacterized protein LOC112599304 [Melanaphis sacchari]
MTQALFGHGCFQAYLLRMHRVADGSCVYCGHLVDDDAAHTIFTCPQWDNEREVMRPYINGRLPTPENVIDLLCGPVGMENTGVNIQTAFHRARSRFCNMVERILSNKEKDERDRQA